MSTSQFEYWKHTQLIIDVIDGHGGGTLSLEGPEGKAFLTRSRVFSDEELATLRQKRLRDTKPHVLPKYHSPVYAFSAACTSRLRPAGLSLRKQRQGQLLTRTLPGCPGHRHHAHARHGQIDWKSKKGADVQRDTFAGRLEGFWPNTGLSTKPICVWLSYAKLSRTAQLECAAWDASCRP